MKIIKNINIIAIVILILLCTLLIGTPIYESNVYYIYIALGVFSIYYFIMQIVKKQKIEISKIDIAVYLLALSSMIPLIMKTYVSLEGTISTILKYFCALNVYIITKHECKKNPNNTNIIINTIIASILILCIIGIDEICNDYLKELKRVINYKYLENDENRVCSLFSYPNTMAAICGTGIFLCISSIWRSKKLVSKILYSTIGLLMLVTMILTYSRLVYILFMIVALFFAFVLAKKYHIIQKVKRKHIIAIAITIVMLIIYIIVGLNISSKLEVHEEYQKIMYQVEPNKLYQFLFEVEAISQENKEDAFTIKLTEKNQYFDDIKVTELAFSNYTGNKEIELVTQNNTAVIYINIVKKEDDAKLIINKALLNNKELILKYKLLPTNVVQKIQGISINNKSTWERAIFIKDGLNLAKENLLFGLGGQAWRVMQTKVQTYNYYAKEMHSFPIKVFIENGLIGFIMCLAIYAYLFKVLLKETKKEEISIQTIATILATLFILLHSILDFDMSFLYIQIIVNVLLATFSAKSTKLNFTSGNITYVILIMISIFSMYTAGLQLYYKKDTEMLKVTSTRTEQKIMQTYYKLQPYSKKIKERYYKSLSSKPKENRQEIYNILKNIILTEKYESKNLNLENIYEYLETSFEIGKNKKEDIKFVLEYIKDTEMFYKYNPSFQISRFNNLNKIIHFLEENNEIEQAKEFQKQLKKEIEKKEIYMFDYEKARYEQNKVIKYRNEIENIDFD